MQRIFIGVSFAVLACLFVPMPWPEPHLKCLKIAVTNPTDQNRPAEDVLVATGRESPLSFFSANHGNSVADKCGPSPHTIAGRSHAKSVAPKFLVTSA
jgi:hypothetical protein